MILCEKIRVTYDKRGKEEGSEDSHRHYYAHKDGKLRLHEESVCSELYAISDKRKLLFLICSFGSSYESLWVLLLSVGKDGISLDSSVEYTYLSRCYVLHLVKRVCDHNDQLICGYFLEKVYYFFCGS